MIIIRPAITADAAAIATVRADSWRAAYATLIPAAALAEATGPASVSAYTENLITRSCAGILVAEPQQPGPSGHQVIGFASFGPAVSASAVDDRTSPTSAVCQTVGGSTSKLRPGGTVTGAWPDGPTLWRQLGSG